MWGLSLTAVNETLLSESLLFPSIDPLGWLVFIVDVEKNPLRVIVGSILHLQISFTVSNCNTAVLATVSTWGAWNTLLCFACYWGKGSLKASPKGPYLETLQAWL